MFVTAVLIVLNTVYTSKILQDVPAKQLDKLEALIDMFV